MDQDQSPQHENEHAKSLVTDTRISELRSRLTQEQREHISSILLYDDKDFYDLVQKGQAISIRSVNIITLLSEIAQGEIPTRRTQKSFMTGVGEEGLFYMNTLSRAPFYDQKPEMLIYLEDFTSFQELSEMEATTREVDENVITYGPTISMGTYFYHYISDHLKEGWEREITRFEQIANKLDPHPLPPETTSDALESYFTRISTELEKLGVGIEQGAFTYGDIIAKGPVTSLQMEYPGLTFVRRLLNKPELTENIIKELSVQVDKTRNHIAVVTFNPTVLDNADVHYWVPFAGDPLVNIENELITRPHLGFIKASAISGIYPIGEGAKADLFKLGIPLAKTTS